MVSAAATSQDTRDASPAATLGAGVGVSVGVGAGAEAGAGGEDRGTVALDSVSVVLPCLNEAAVVGRVVAEASDALCRLGRPFEVIVVDNGSGDGSDEAAARAGARIVAEPVRGYGAAVAAGVRAAAGEVVVVADADGSYDLGRVGDLLAPLAEGADLVVGTRFDGAEPAAMPWLHRRLGTPVLTALLRLLTGTRVGDSQSGFRVARRESILALDLRTPGMEYASEMLLRAERAGLRVVSVPTPYRVRVGASKLDPWADGWRHLRLLILLSPQLSLIAPGVLAGAIGLVLCAISLIAPTGLALGGVRWLPVFLGPMLLILGAQAALLGSLAAHRSPLAPPRLRRRLAWLDRPRSVARLVGCFAGVAGAGLAIDGVLLVLWLAGHSGARLLGVAGLAQALIVIGLGAIATLLAVEFSRDALLR